MDKTQTQKERIVAYLQEGGTLTTVKGFSLGFGTKMPTRIGELINNGYPIIKTRLESGEMEYSMPRTQEELDDLFVAG